MALSSRIAAGKLRHEIDIVIPTNAQDASGGTDISDNVVFATVWASIEALTGRDQLAVGEFVSTTSHKITIRYLAGVTAKMQVWFAGRQFQIACVLNPDERTKMLVLLCLEVANSSQQVVGS
jgi:SPP1 family predicted phage head-tail adaptor